MAFNLVQLKAEIIEPTLRAIEMYSPQAVNLLVGTMAHESRLGYYFVQVNGPALGPYQIEPFTHDDRVNNYIVHRKSLLESINNLGYLDFDSNRLKYDIVYSTIFARIKYWSVPEKIPSSVEGIAAYWKEHYNTKNGKGSESEFIDNYHRYVK